MFQLRGLADCTSTPNDPVCVAFNTIQVKIPGAIVGTAATRPGSVGSGNVAVQQPSTPGVPVSPTVGANAWYSTWWGIALLGAGAYGLWRYSRPAPKSTTAAPALSGHRRRARR